MASNRISATEVPTDIELLSAPHPAEITGLVDLAPTRWTRLV